jgi:hypothetical protein
MQRGQYFIIVRQTLKCKLACKYPTTRYFIQEVIGLHESVQDRNRSRRQGFLLHFSLPADFAMLIRSLLKMQLENGIDRPEVAILLEATEVTRNLKVMSRDII